MVALNLFICLLQTQVEVAIAAADRDLNVAAEILMSQQVYLSQVHHILR